MARWKLKAPHYLQVLGTKWEKLEMSTTGQQNRQQYDVPKFLNPDDPADWNDRVDGAIIVAQGSAHPKDIIFLGEPTPDMEPLDDEAREISESHQDKWKVRTEVELTMSDIILDRVARMPVTPPAPATDPAIGADLTKALTAIAESQTLIAQSLASGRRV